MCMYTCFSWGVYYVTLYCEQEAKDICLMSLTVGGCLAQMSFSDSDWSETNFGGCCGDTVVDSDSDTENDNSGAGAPVVVPVAAVVVAPRPLPRPPTGPYGWDRWRLELRSRSETAIRAVWLRTTLWPILAARFGLTRRPSYITAACLFYTP